MFNPLLNLHLIPLAHFGISRFLAQVLFVLIEALFSAIRSSLHAVDTLPTIVHIVSLSVLSIIHRTHTSIDSCRKSIVMV
ncbi:uncharacterized protein BJ171DRAFT_540888 [Polychytrium aggregatum]|uniref:uncharacterized protein n=1 Tax=Polychytrium aggregatum TaxID=110093 RepID=UPI0022FE04DF|nr:uncharacterized protein BJ171DRAFT_540888 [Polychytrium aggregatum]KAI9190724.1 hypothetical protein BJ171DRAFT_540888 [Polychytrium aggregatum]